MVALNPRRLGHLCDRHGRMILDQPGQVAFVLRREVQNDHKRQPAIVAHMLEELLQRLQPARRRAYADDPRLAERAAIVERLGLRFRLRYIGFAHMSLLELSLAGHVQFLAGRFFALRGEKRPT